MSTVTVSETHESHGIKILQSLTKVEDMDKICQYGLCVFSTILELED